MSFRSIRRAIIDANHKALAIERGRGEVLAALGARIAKGERISDDEVAGACSLTAKASRTRPQLATKLSHPQIVRGARGGDIAILSFRGVVTYDIEAQPYAVSTKLFARMVHQLSADDTVSAIGIIMDSPGGTVTGTEEAAAAVFAARQRKAVTAIVDPLAASAAYWIASQASEIVAIPSADVGSIGVFMLHMDCSGMFEEAGIKPTFIYAGEYKVEGNSLEPLGEEAKANWQEGCDTVYADFLKAVARGREMSVARVREMFGKGRTVPAKDALRLGMIDRTMLSDDATTRLISGPARSQRQGRSLGQIFEGGTSGRKAEAAEHECMMRWLEAEEARNASACRAYEGASNPELERLRAEIERMAR